MALKHQILEQRLHRQAAQQGQRLLNQPQPLMPCSCCFLATQWLLMRPCTSTSPCSRIPLTMSATCPAQRPVQHLDIKLCIHTREHPEAGPAPHAMHLLPLHSQNALAHAECSSVKHGGAFRAQDAFVEQQMHREAVQTSYLQGRDSLTAFTAHVSHMRIAASLTRQEHKLLHAGGTPQLLAQQRQQQPGAPAAQQERQDRHRCPGHLARRQERAERDFPHALVRRVHAPPGPPAAVA